MQQQLFDNFFSVATVKRYLLILLCLSTLVNADSTRDIAYSTFDPVVSSNSLSQKTVQVVFQDSTGLIWLGTQEGLNLYDGQSFKIYRHRNDQKDSLSHDVIKSIAESPDGRIYVATRGGLDILNRDWNGFSHVALKDSSGKPVNRINTVYFTPSGELWVGTDGQGVFRGASTKSDSEGARFEQILSKIDVTSVYQDSRNRTWIGTDGNGIYFNKGNKKWINLSTENSTISHNRVRDIAENKKGQIWIATRGGGINLFDEVSEEFKTYNTDNESHSRNRVYKLLFDHADTLWAATDNGIAVLPAGQQQFINIKHDEANRKSLSNNRVLTLMQDKSNLIWIGTISGINIYNPQTNKVVNYRHSAVIDDSLTHQTITHFENFGSSILISTYGGGIEELDTVHNRFSSIVSESKGNLTDNRVMTMMMDHASNLWVGTRGSGVQVLNKQFANSRHFEVKSDRTNSLSANGITDILEDKNGNIWIATYRAGLNLLNNDKKSFTHFRVHSQVEDDNVTGLRSENIYQILEDEDGYIWLATDGGGLSRLDQHKREAITIVHQPEIADSLSGDIIMSMFIDSKGRFWIGTQGNGLNRWEPEDRRNLRQNFRHYARQQGLESSSINGILEDDNGMIWLSTNQGVSKLNPETDEFQHFNLSEKSDGNELNQGALIKAHDGRFYFGGINGISAFYPDELISNPHVPNVILRQVLIKNKPVDLPQAAHLKKSLTLQHDDYLVSFDLASLDYAEPNKNQYQYKLEGFDEDWIALGAYNRVTFTNLPAGNYQLLVRGSNNNGLWSEQKKVMDVKVLPAWWQSWWALSLYAAAFVLLMLVVIRQQAKRLVNQDLIQQQINSQVSEKTRLLAEHQQRLNDQLKQAYRNVIYDSQTGLPSRRFCSEILGLLLSWQSEISNQNKETSVVINLALVKYSTAQMKEDFTPLKMVQGALHGAPIESLFVGHWQAGEILLFYLQESGSEIKPITKNNGVEHWLQISLPCEGQSEQLKWEQILLVMEHVLSLQSGTNKKIQRIVRFRVHITQKTVHEIISCQNLIELSEFLLIESWPDARCQKLSR